MTSEHRLVLAFGEFQFDPATTDLRRGSGVVPLAPKALALLGYLASRPGRLVSKRELLDAVWPDTFVGDGVLKVCMRELQSALDDDARAPRFIETAHRRGYRFIAAVRELGEPLAKTVPALASQPAAGTGTPATPRVERVDTDLGHDILAGAVLRRAADCLHLGCRGGGHGATESGSSRLAARRFA